MTNFQIGIHMFLQLAVIVAVCRLFGLLGRRLLGQTQVFMEMVAGVALGPSIFGAIWPSAQTWLFPKLLTLPSGISAPHPNMSILYAIAQIGLVLYMFVIGLELDFGLLRGRVRSAALVSGAGIVVPFGVAAVLLPLLISRGDMFAKTVPWGVAWLFVGASISITAFPMLARILYEHGLTSTPIGALTLAAGSIDDAVAWCLLAIVLAVFKEVPSIAILAVAGGIAYGVFMLTIGRRLLARFLGRNTSLSIDAFVGVLILLLVCAWLTDAIGIYAVFGAFVCGAAMPKSRAHELAKRIEPITVTLLLPMFFVYSGLNTRLSLLNGLSLWLVAGAVLLASTLAKGVACTVAARASGESWGRASVVGVLMNARGLMELILLNIGLERGVLTPTLFAVLVLMAVVTTGIASPLYRLLARWIDVKPSHLRVGLAEAQKTPGAAAHEAAPPAAA